MASSVKGTKDLEMAIRVLKHAGPDIKREFRREAASWAPTLSRAIQAHAHGPVDQQIAASTRTTTTNRGLQATIGGRGKLSGGAKLGEVTRPQEFGTTRQNVKERYRSTSPKGRTYTLNRRTKKQVPRSAPKGRFIYQGLADATPELVTRYVKAVVEVIYRAQ